MARLILHSDDLGLHPAIDGAILACAENGVLSSASILANGPTAAHALSRAAKVAALGVGVHLNIVRGRPLSPPHEVPSLVGADGRFFNSMAKLFVRANLNKVRPEEVCAEYRRQICFVLDHGMAPSHLDSEKHSHLFLPQASQAVRQLCAEFGISRIRRVNETPLRGFLRVAERYPRGGVAQQMKLRLIEYFNRRRSKLFAHLHSPDYTWGIAWEGSRVARALPRFMSGLFTSAHACTIEWIFHIGYALDYRALSREFGTFFLTDSRAEETALLLSCEVKEIVARHRARLISYREL